LTRQDILLLVKYPKQPSIPHPSSKPTPLQWQHCRCYHDMHLFQSGRPFGIRNMEATSPDSGWPAAVHERLKSPHPSSRCCIVWVTEKASLNKLLLVQIPHILVDLLYVAPT
jgi:hypothetical protein